MEQKTFAFFPEAAFGPALNSVGIAQAVEPPRPQGGVPLGPGLRRGLRGLRLRGPSGGALRADAARADGEVLGGLHQRPHPELPQSPIDQIDNYVKDCWEAIVDSAKWAEKDLPGVLAKIKPDVICVDNVILFPAIKQYGVPWVRIISCSENEIEDEAIPPHLSGCRRTTRRATPLSVPV